MKQTPIDKQIVDGLIEKLGITDFAKATIREVKQVAARQNRKPALSSSRWKWVFPGFLPPRLA